MVARPAPARWGGVRDRQSVDLDAAHAGSGVRAEYSPATFSRRRRACARRRPRGIGFAQAGPRRARRWLAALMEPRTTAVCCPPSRVPAISFNLGQLPLAQAGVTKFNSDEWKAQTGVRSTTSIRWVSAGAVVDGRHRRRSLHPRFTEQLDYELEIATIIGRTAKNVTKKMRSITSRGFASSTTYPRGISRRASIEQGDPPRQELRYLVSARSMADYA